MISIIVAIAANGAIGAKNDLLWRLPNDMKRFKELTTGHTVIMGRKTFESLPKGALPNRTNVVITGNAQASFKDCEIVDSLDAAISKHKNENEIFIIGGANVYKQAIVFADKLYVTYVHHTFENADTFFSEINNNEWIMTENEDFPCDEKHLFPYTFQTYIKKK
ncbi:MAG: dihydrofolate reductase [Tannerella sp.]|jgi:dihydrofolate reductase|nr:dihydrofolate reductase [Tannerella sp.]